MAPCPHGIFSHLSSPPLLTPAPNQKKKDYDAQDLIEFEETILRGVGYDKDGKISRKELTMILLALAKLPPDDDQ